MQKMQKLFAPRDLTQGNPVEGIAVFAIPLLLGNLAQQLYNTVDAIVVGQYIGDAALGAVGLVGPILNLMLVLFMGLSTGTTIVVSQYFGAKDRQGLSHAVGTTVMMTLWCGILMSIIGVVCARPLLTLLSTPESMQNMAADYLIVIMLGMTGCAFYAILSGVLRGLGDSISPLFYLLIASALNIVLDIAFVTVFEMKTEGVAWATIIAQSVSALLCYLRLCRMTDVLDLNRKTLRINRPIMKRIVGLGVPAGLTQMIFSLSSILLQSLTNSFGPNAVTAVTAVMRVDGFAMMPNFTFGVAATTFTGQNVGARRLDRVHQGAKITLLMAIGTSTLLTACILLFGEGLMRVFTQTNDIVMIGMGMMQLLAVGYIAFGVTQTLQGVMRGAGETIIPMWISIVVTIIVRMPIAYLWAYWTRTPEMPAGDYRCLYGSLLISWLLGCAITVFLYYKGNWRRKMMDIGAQTEPKPEGGL